MQDAGTDENGECVLQVFGDGGGGVTAFGAGQSGTVTAAASRRINRCLTDGIFGDSDKESVFNDYLQILGGTTRWQLYSMTLS